MRHKIMLTTLDQLQIILETNSNLFRTISLKRNTNKIVYIYCMYA